MSLSCGFLLIVFEGILKKAEMQEPVLHTNIINQVQFTCMAHFLWTKPKGTFLADASVHAVWFIRDTMIFGLELSLKFVRIQSSLVP